jgi:hypothetical protein
MKEIRLVSEDVYLGYTTKNHAVRQAYIAA